MNLTSYYFLLENVLIWSTSIDFFYFFLFQKREIEWEGSVVGNVFMCAHGPFPLMKELMVNQRLTAHLIVNYGSQWGLVTQCSPGLWNSSAAEKRPIKSQTFLGTNQRPEQPDIFHHSVNRNAAETAQLRHLFRRVCVRACVCLPGVYNNTSTAWGAANSTEGLILCFSVSAVVLGTIIGAGDTKQK